MMYTLQMWNSYLFVASLDVLVVLLAGFISIFSLRRSQKAIEKVSPALPQGPAVLTCATINHQTVASCNAYLLNLFLMGR